MLTESAVVLSWAPSNRTTAGAALPEPASYRVYRTTIPSPGSGAVPAQAPTSAGAALPSLSVPFALLADLPPASAEYRDTTFEFGQSYLYTIRAVTRFGPDAVESSDAPPATVIAKDVFPPAAPQDLEAVIVPETAGEPPYVELAWRISPEPDVSGYYVFRSEQEDAPGTRLDTGILPAPTYRDTKVETGRRYFYRVVAVDRSGNESPLSSAVEAAVPGP